MSEQKFKYELHPVANMFPLMSDEEYAGLKEDIAANGLHESIVVWNGKLIDGRNRLRACEELGVSPKILTLSDGDDPFRYAVSRNLHRRHLSSSQRAMLASEIASNTHGGIRRTDGSKSPIDVLNIDDAAKKLNVSPKSVERANKVKKHGTPELAAMVTSGKVTVDVASKLASKTKEEQHEIVSKGPNAVKEAAKHISQKVGKSKPLPKTVMSQSPEELRANIQAVGETLLALIKEMDRLSDQIGGEWIDTQEVETRALSLRDLIRGFAHWVDCPKCKGKGCDVCKRIGWLSVERKQFLSPEMKVLLGIKK